MPVEPPPCRWEFPPAVSADNAGLVGFGADLEPGTLLGAYRRGLFPMPVRFRGPMAWWSPDPRGIIPLHGLRVSRSLRRSLGRYELRTDSAFEQVVAACADPRRRGAWITPSIQAAYTRLHDLGWAHSVEAWSRDEGTLAGGLYGVAVGGLFAGESMFHRATDASKVALLGLVEMLGAGGDGRLLDVQWVTPHLATLGATEVPATGYLELLEAALAQPLPPVFA
ncbi:MAG: leucyl/phenylalanyl-tRNA--protein transferase [Acidimicrobiia bacterium]